MAVLVREDREYNRSSEFKLTEYQTDGVEFLLGHPNSILGFKAGTGKTFTILTAAKHLIEWKNDICIVILCPSSATSIFRKEAKHKLRMPMCISTTNVTQREKGARLFLFNYSRLEQCVKFISIAKQKGLYIVVIMDEVHKVQHPESSLYKTIKEKIRPYMTFVWGMTATPYLNDLDGLFYTMDIVRPGVFGTIYQFHANYIVYKRKQIYRRGKKVTISEIVGYKNLDHLNQIVNLYIIIRGKTYDIKFEEIKVELIPQEQEAYNLAAKGIIDEKYDIDNEKDFGGRLHDLQRVADGSYIKDVEFVPTKIKACVNLIKQIVMKNEGALIYTEYEDTYTVLEKYLKENKRAVGYRNLYMINGKVKYSTRVDIERKLSPRDIVIVTKAGCESLNLQAVNHVIFYDIPFAVSAVIQMLGRICRMDSVYPVKYCHLIEVKDTVDSYKRMLFAEHKQLIVEVLGEDRNLPNFSELDRETITKMHQYMKNKFLWKRF